jgi:hypothetical protein
MSPANSGSAAGPDAAQETPAVSRAQPAGAAAVGLGVGLRALARALADGGWGMAVLVGWRQ